MLTDDLAVEIGWREFSAPERASVLSPDRVTPPNEINEGVPLARLPCRALAETRHPDSIDAPNTLFRVAKASARSRARFYQRLED